MGFGSIEMVSTVPCLVQSMEPFFSVLLSSIFLGDTPSIPVLLSLLPIVGGVVAASASEATFNWPGFLAAMGSNVTFQSRNVFSKKFMGSKRVCSLAPFRISPELGSSLSSRRDALPSS